MARDLAAERLRFERYGTMDIVLSGPHCACWKPQGGPFIWHPPACLCPCHGERTSG